jgi:hypothetical protein
MPVAKVEILERIHQQVQPQVARIANGGGEREDKAKLVNAAISAARQGFVHRIAALPVAERPDAALTLQYCCSVASLEYRHSVWPYEYMAFSRRVGELWQAFCNSAWDLPSRPGVKRIAMPSFDTVRGELLGRITDNLDGHEKRDDVLKDVATLFEIVGDINMSEDEVFSVDDVPHVIDFKSGFGSNEKGNMVRLLTVGRAYKIWNPDTRLMLLVRQDENNNYLKVLKRSGLWDVHTGDNAYAQISQLTGADMQAVRRDVIDWDADLSPDFVAFLGANNLRGYLRW